MTTEQPAMRYCLTCKKESPKADFRFQKCGPCCKKWGVPRTAKSTFNNHGSLQHKASICKNEGFIR